MDIKEVLQKHEFRFKKSLGQNFLVDVKLLENIVDRAEINEDDIVLEIGTGAGTLTKVISQKAKSVVSFDIDRSLEPILEETLRGIENVEVVFRDIMKLSDDEIMDLAKGPFKIVANIPYNITSPLIMRFVESNLPLISATIMVQQEIADRMTALPGTPEYGSITVSLQLRADVSKLIKVSRNMFYPVPKVDSAVIHIVVNDEKYSYKDKVTLKRLIRSGFHMRRKIFANNIISAFPEINKEKALELLVSLGYREDVRGEDLSVEDYIKIADEIYEISGVGDALPQEDLNIYEDDMHFEEEYEFISEEGTTNLLEIDIIDYEK